MRPSSGRLASAQLQLQVAAGQNSGGTPHPFLAYPHPPVHGDGRERHTGDSQDRAQGDT